MIFRQLFALICPIGFLRLYFGGGGGSSKSSNDTTNIDRRVAVDSGAGISGDNSSITINSVDGGIVARALDSVDLAGANNNTGFRALLDASRDLFNRGESLIGQTQKAVADAYGQAQNDKAGTIDNRTIIIIAVVVAGLIGAAIFKGKKA